MKLSILIAVVCIGSAAIAQTTVTLSQDSGSTEVTVQRDALFTSATFEERLNRAQALYERAGIPQEKIQKLRDLDESALTNQARGQAVNYVKMRQEKRRILSAEEMETLNRIQKEMATETATTETENQ